MARIHFGGTELQTSGDAKGVVMLLASVARGERASDQGQPLPVGYAAMQTEHGPVYVNASQVDYVRD